MIKTLSVFLLASFYLFGTNTSFAKDSRSYQFRRFYPTPETLEVKEKNSKWILSLTIDNNDLTKKLECSFDAEGTLSNHNFIGTIKKKYDKKETSIEAVIPIENGEPAYFITKKLPFCSYKNNLRGIFFSDIGPKHEYVIDSYICPTLSNVKKASRYMRASVAERPDAPEDNDDNIMKNARCTYKKDTYINSEVLDIVKGHQALWYLYRSYDAYAFIPTPETSEN